MASFRVNLVRLQLILPPSIHPPIPSMTALAHESSVFCLEKWARSNSSLTYDVNTCFRVFLLVNFSSSFSSTPCASTTSDFISKNFSSPSKFFCAEGTQLLLLASNHRRWKPIPKKRVLNCDLKAQYAKTHATLSRALDGDPFGLSHPQHVMLRCPPFVFPSFFYISIVSVVTGSVFS